MIGRLLGILRAAPQGMAIALVAMIMPLVAQAEAVTGQPYPWQMGFQAAASPVKHRVDQFHDMLLVIITAIALFVTVLLAYVVVRYRAKANPTPSKTSHNTLIEIIWTAVPVLILVVIAVPSLSLLYYMERVPEAEMTIKVTGKQWYWEYEYPDQKGIAITAVMVEDKDLKPGQPRLLATDNNLVLPIDTNIRIQTTAADVIHSWAVPALGVKKDAVPGRLNETWLRIEKEGMYYGQCSEICGERHGFMPIAIEAVSKERFAEWVQQKVAGDVGESSTRIANSQP